MQLSTRGRYAVMAMLDILHIQSERGNEIPVKLSQVADRQHISLSYLEQLFAQLRRAGLVKSVRGPGGGYVLGNPAYETWLGDIVNAVDEPVSVTRCNKSAQKACVNGRQCNAHYLWVAMGDCISSFLNQLSLQMVVDNDFGDFTPAEILESKNNQNTKSKVKIA